MATASSAPSLSLSRSLFAGLGAGVVAAIAASLLSLPLRSPDDAFLNTASVTVGALLAGLLAGAVWWALRRRVTPARTFAAILAGVLILAAAAAFAGERVPNFGLDGMVRFVVPLAALSLVVIGILTPRLARPRLRAGLLAPAGALLALIVGGALAGEGDAESGRLALPALPTPASTVARDAASSATPVTTAPGASNTTAPATAPAASDGRIRASDVAGVAFTVTPGESAATYTVREKLARLPLPNDAVGRTDQVSGTVYLDGRPSTVTVDLRTLQSDQPQRDNFIRTRGPELNRYPLAQFTVANLVDLPTEYQPGETVTRSVTGTLRIREVERPATFAVEARLQDNVLYVLGRMEFTWAEFQIPPPNVAGIVQVEDTARVEVLLVARRASQG